MKNMSDAIPTRNECFSVTLTDISHLTLSKQDVSGKHTWRATHTHHHCLPLLPTCEHGCLVATFRSRAMVSFRPRQSPEDKESTFFKAINGHLHPNYISALPQLTNAPRPWMGCWFFPGEPSPEAGVGKSPHYHQETSKPRAPRGCGGSSADLFTWSLERETSGRYLLEQKRAWRRNVL